MFCFTVVLIKMHLYIVKVHFYISILMQRCNNVKCSKIKITQTMNLLVYGRQQQWEFISMLVGKISFSQENHLKSHKVQNNKQITKKNTNKFNLCCMALY